MAILEVNNVKKIYTTRFGGNQVQALKNINFSVEKGEYVAIMGESGSGKTTYRKSTGTGNIFCGSDRHCRRSFIRYTVPHETECGRSGQHLCAVYDGSGYDFHDSKYVCRSG